MVLNNLNTELTDEMFYFSDWRLLVYANGSAKYFLLKIISLNRKFVHTYISDDYHSSQSYSLVIYRKINMHNLL